MGNKSSKTSTKINRLNVFIEDIAVELFINEFISENKITIHLINNLESTVEIECYLPISKSTIFKSFIATIGGKTIVSKVKEKEKANEEFADQLAQGNTALIGNYSEDNENIRFILGNLLPKEKLKLEILTSNLIESEDKSLKSVFSIMNLPSFIAKENSSKIEFKSDSETKLSFNATVSCREEITRLICIGITDLKAKFSPDNKISEIFLSKKQLTDVNEVSILFRYKNMNLPTIFQEYDEKRNLYAYNVSCVFDDYKNVPVSKKVDLNNKVNYSEKYDKNLINDYPASFIFLVDQSGSMSGESINIAKEGLKLFVKSLPQNSEFDIIGFGSSFKRYFDKPYDYNEENVKQALSVINNLDANLGGTNIYSPLLSIYSLEKSYKEDLLKRIFVLTDGAVSDSSQCYKIASKYSNTFTIHAIGVGESVDKDFVKKLGEVGKGSCQIAPKVNQLKSAVISSLNSALQPYITISNIRLPENLKILNSFPSNFEKSLIKQDCLLSYSFISENPLDMNDEIELSYKNNSLESTETIKIKVNESLLKLLNGDQLAKSIIGIKLKSEEKTIEEKLSVELSLKYNILSHYTSLFAVIENEDKIIGEVQSIKLDSSNKGYDIKADNTRTFNNQITSMLSSNTQPERFRSLTKSEGYNPPILLDKAAKKMSNYKEEKITSPTTNNKKVDSVYDNIIISQKTNGSWSESSITITELRSKYQKKYDTITTEIKSNTSIDLNLISIDDAITTLFIIFILKSIYSNLIEEHKLIINKSEKLLKRAKVIV